MATASKQVTCPTCQGIMCPTCDNKGKVDRELTNEELKQQVVGLLDFIEELNRNHEERYEKLQKEVDRANLTYIPTFSDIY